MEGRSKMACRSNGSSKYIAHEHRPSLTPQGYFKKLQDISRHRIPLSPHPLEFLSARTHSSSASMSSNTWTLPGRLAHTTPFWPTKAMLASAFSYSRKYNSRNLESYWYSVYVETLIALVADVESLVVMPQPTIWHWPTEDVLEDFNVVLGSPLSGTSTIPEHGVPERIPDFAIYFLKSIWRKPYPDQLYRRHFKHLRIVHVGIPIIVEIKRSATRAPTVQGSKIPGQEATEDIWENMGEASAQLCLYSVMLFEMYPKQQSVIAMACAGPWWSTTTLTRDQALSFANKSPDADYSLPDISLEPVEKDGEMVPEQEMDDILDNLDLEEAEETDSSESESESDNSPAVKWSGPFELESRSSMLALRKMHDDLTAIPKQWGTPAAWC